MIYTRIRNNHPTKNKTQIESSEIEIKSKFALSGRVSPYFLSNTPATPRQQKEKKPKKQNPHFRKNRVLSNNHGGKNTVQHPYNRNLLTLPLTHSQTQNSTSVASPKKKIQKVQGKNRLAALPLLRLHSPKRKKDFKKKAAQKSEKIAPISIPLLFGRG